MTQQNGPPCPKPSRVRELIEIYNNEGAITPKDALDLTDALDWLATSLENRNLYHKKQQIKNKIVRALAKEYGLDDQANVLTDDAMHTLVSNQPPDKQDVIDLTELNNLQGDLDAK